MWRRTGSRSASWIKAWYYESWCKPKMFITEEWSHRIYIITTFNQYMNNEPAFNHLSWSTYCGQQSYICVSAMSVTRVETQLLGQEAGDWTVDSSMDVQDGSYGFPAMGTALLFSLKRYVIHVSWRQDDTAASWSDIIYECCIQQKLEIEKLAV